MAPRTPSSSRSSAACSVVVYKRGMVEPENAAEERALVEYIRAHAVEQLERGEDAAGVLVGAGLAYLGVKYFGGA